MGKVYTPDVSIENTENGVRYRVWLVASGLRYNGSFNQSTYIPTEIYGQIEPAFRTYTPPSDEHIRALGMVVIGPISGFTLTRVRPTSAHYELISIRGKTVVGAGGAAPLTDSNWLFQQAAQFPGTLRIYKIVREDGKMSAKCTPDSCRVDCATALDGFCCIDHSLTNRLGEVLSF
jgi:hypothetical protein